VGCGVPTSGGDDGVVVGCGVPTSGGDDGVVVGCGVPTSGSADDVAEADGWGLGGPLGATGSGSGGASGAWTCQPRSGREGRTVPPTARRASGVGVWARGTAARPAGTVGSANILATAVCAVLGARERGGTNLCPCAKRRPRGRSSATLIATAVSERWRSAHLIMLSGLFSRQHAGRAARAQRLARSTGAGETATPAAPTGRTQRRRRCGPLSTHDPESHTPDGERDGTPSSARPRARSAAHLCPPWQLSRPLDDSPSAPKNSPSAWPIHVCRPGVTEAAATCKVALCLGEKECRSVSWA